MAFNRTIIAHALVRCPNIHVHFQSYRCAEVKTEGDRNVVLDRLLDILTCDKTLKYAALLSRIGVCCSPSSFTPKSSSISPHCTRYEVMGASDGGGCHVRRHVMLPRLMTNVLCSWSGGSGTRRGAVRERRQPTLVSVT